MTDYNIILNNRQYGRVVGDTFRVGKIVFNTINNLRGIGLPIQALISLKVSSVKSIEFHYKTRAKHILFRCDPSLFAKRFSEFEDNGLKHSFVPLMNMDRIIMEDERGKQKTLMEVDKK